MLDLIDAVTLAGSRRRPNEDAFGRAGNRAWVIDGATGLGDPIVSSTSDAAWLATRASHFFAARAHVEDTRAMMAMVADDLQQAFLRERRREPRERWEIPCGAFMMLTMGEGEACELAWLGDCRAILEGADGRLQAFGATPASEAREAGEAANYAGEDPAARYRAPQALAMLRAGRARFNTPGHAAVLAPESGFVAGVTIRQATFAPPGHALLMTDGFAAIELRYGDIGAGPLVAAAREKGLARLAIRLREIEEELDPDAVRHPRWKRSDDATAMLLAAA